MNKTSLGDFSLSRTSSVEDIILSLRRHGVTVIPSWCNGNIIESLTAEFNEALQEPNNDYAYRINYPAGAATSLMRDKLPENRYSAIKNIFNNKFMRDVVNGYIGVNGLLNYEVYATHEYNPSIHVAPTHHDKLWSVKFMLYLNDIGKENAPFGVIPGSAPHARSNFREIFNKNNLHRLSMSSQLYQAMDNSAVPPGSNSVVDIVGSAGTLIIFDTDTFHHAGSVVPGKERRILRGHSGPSVTYSSVRKNSRQWWRGEKSFSRFDDWMEKFIEKMDTISSPISSKNAK